MSIGAAAIEKGTIDVTVDALGTVTSLPTVTVKSQVTGPLVQVNFKEGQGVSKGDLLAASAAAAPMVAKPAAGRVTSGHVAPGASYWTDATAQTDAMSPTLWQMAGPSKRGSSTSVCVSSSGWPVKNTGGG